MLSTKAKLFSTLQSLKKLKILVVGDIILDRYIWGAVSRISPEAPVPVVESTSIEDRLGGAANVLRNLTNIGCQVSILGLVGRDAEGERIKYLLRKSGADISALVFDKNRPSTLKTRIVAQRQQVLRVDREKRCIPEKAVRLKLLAELKRAAAKADAIIISDYGKGVVCAELLEFLQSQKDAGKISLKHCPLVVDPHPSNYSLYKSFTIAKPNRREAEKAVGISITDKKSALLVANKLLQQWQSEMVVISLGEDGLLIVGSKQAPLFIETIAQDVFDVSGAGDAVTALFSAAIAAGAEPHVAGDLANIAAGVVVSEVGTVAITLDKLKAEIEMQAKARSPQHNRKKK